MKWFIGKYIDKLASTAMVIYLINKPRSVGIVAFGKIVSDDYFLSTLSLLIP